MGALGMLAALTTYAAVGWVIVMTYRDSRARGE